jgi:hypothetical protein
VGGQFAHLLRADQLRDLRRGLGQLGSSTTLRLRRHAVRQRAGVVEGPFGQLGRDPPRLRGYRSGLRGLLK